MQIERAANGRYQWQLKAPNGRIVAVSAMVHESPQEADRAFAALRGDAAELTARITHVRDGIGWIWVVPGPRGVPEARSSRAYERYATCQNAFRRFTALLERQVPGHPPGPPAVARERSPHAGADQPGPLRPPRSGGDA
ncbi:YegP family protein [Kitasatospora sp. NPDC008050]|uniref:YegP family protein n=1 Tax=Kitasatospora sp. NPDC008050 TaxID=3364021 RepID=UPI0036E7C186